LIKNVYNLGPREIYSVNSVPQSSNNEMTHLICFHGQFKMPELSVENGDEALIDEMPAARRVQQQQLVSQRQVG
jgi:hypothetical protein